MDIYVCKIYNQLICCFRYPQGRYGFSFWRFVGVPVYCKMYILYNVYGGMIFKPTCRHSVEVGGCVYVPPVPNPVCFATFRKRQGLAGWRQIWASDSSNHAIGLNWLRKRAGCRRRWHKRLQQCECRSIQKKQAVQATPSLRFHIVPSGLKSYEFPHGCAKINFLF